MPHEATNKPGNSGLTQPFPRPQRKSKSYLFSGKNSECGPAFNVASESQETSAFGTRSGAGISGLFTERARRLWFEWMAAVHSQNHGRHSKARAETIACTGQWSHTPLPPIVQKRATPITNVHTSFRMFLNAQISVKMTRNKRLVVKSTHDSPGAREG